MVPCAVDPQMTAFQSPTKHIMLSQLCLQAFSQTESEIGIGNIMRLEKEKWRLKRDAI